MGVNTNINMGRTRIPMEYRTDDQARRVTLCKRKKGLYKKAEELAQLCGIEVAMVIVGDGCKPAQMVATGSGNYHDIASTYRVMTRYTQLVKGQPIETPVAAMDSRETLIQQQKELERQRREIEQLRRQLEEVRGGMFEAPREDEEGAEEIARPRKRSRAPVAKRKLADRAFSAPSAASNVTVEDSTMSSMMMDNSILSEMTMDGVSDVMQEMGNEILSSSTDADIDAEIDYFYVNRTAPVLNKISHTRNRSGEWSTMMSEPQEPQVEEALIESGMMSMDEIDLAFDGGVRHKLTAAKQLAISRETTTTNLHMMHEYPAATSVLGGCVP